MLTKAKEDIIEYIYYCVGSGANVIEFDVSRGINGELALMSNENRAYKFIMNLFLFVCLC